jgi:hypothetical protein
MGFKTLWIGVMCLFLSGCVTTCDPEKNKLPTKPDNPTNSGTNFLNTSAPETLKKASESTQNADKGVDGATAKVNEAKTGVQETVAATEAKVNSGAPPPEVKQTLQTGADGVQKNLDEALTNLKTADLEVEKLKVLLAESSKKVEALVAENKKADQAFKDLEKSSKADKENALKEQKIANDLVIKDKDNIIKDKDKIISERDATIKEKDEWWNKWILGIVALSSLGCGVTCLVFLIFFKSPKQAIEFVAFGAGIVVIYAAWKGLFKAVPHVEIIVMIVVITAAIRLAIAMINKSKVITDLVKTVDLVKKFDKWGPEEKFKVMQIQSDETIQTVAAAEKGLNLVAADVTKTTVPTPAVGG